MPLVESEVENVKPGVTIERAKGFPARRVDKRGLLEMLRDEIDEKLSISAKKERRVGPEGKSLSEFVDEAVNGAPAPGPTNDF